MDSSPQERRHFGRLNLLAYGQNMKCTLELEGLRRQAELIDISAGGARLRWTSSPEEPRGMSLVFSLSSTSDGGLLQGLSSVIRWTHGLEFGIQFVHELDVPVSTLQRMVC